MNDDPRFPPTGSPEAVGHARAMLAQSELLHDAGQVTAAYDRMAEAIVRCYGAQPVHALCIMTGGLVTCAELIRRLGSTTLTLDYLHATRYRGETSGSGLVWKVAPPADLEDRHVLLIDDILDEGHTLHAVCDAIAANRPASLRVAVLVDKQHDRRVAGARADFTGLTVPDRYVFGCGMDYRGFWRQLPEIRAVAT